MGNQQDIGSLSSISHSHI